MRFSPKSSEATLQTKQKIFNSDTNLNNRSSFQTICYNFYGQISGPRNLHVYVCTKKCLECFIDYDALSNTRYRVTVKKH